MFNTVEENKKKEVKVEVVDGNIKTTTIVEEKFEKTKKLDSGGTQTFSVKEIGNDIIITSVATEEFSANQFMRIATRLRERRDSFKQAVDNYNQFDEEWKRFEPFVKKARELMDEAYKKQKIEIEESNRKSKARAFVEEQRNIKKKGEG